MLLFRSTIVGVGWSIGLARWAIGLVGRAFIGRALRAFIGRALRAFIFFAFRASIGFTFGALRTLRALIFRLFIFRSLGSFVSMRGSWGV